MILPQRPIPGPNRTLPGRGVEANISQLTECSPSPKAVAQIDGHFKYDSLLTATDSRSMDNDSDLLSVVAR
jgi:hypothetical protein